jgi:hypothetical protein
MVPTGDHYYSTTLGTVESSFQSGSGEQKLLWAGVSALLNAAAIGNTYPLTPSMVISQVYDAINSGNSTWMTDLTTMLTYWNHNVPGEVCPLS